MSKQEQLEVCCELTYRMRRVQSKGAILVLVWSHLVVSVFHFLQNDKVSDSPQNGKGSWLGLMVFGITLPLVGWLADAYIGRYKVIRFSVWMAWIATVLAIVSSITAQLTESYDHINSTVTQMLFCLMGIGLGGFQSTIIQFGVDQLFDASTTEITSFIIWYVWTLFSGGIVINFTIYHLSKKYLVLMLLFLCTNLSLVLVSLSCCNSWLIKEPAMRNPFKLIYKVITYAIRNKHPRCCLLYTSDAADE